MHDATAHVKAMRREAIAAAEYVMHGLTCEKCECYPEAAMVLTICEWTEEEFLRAVMEHLEAAP